MNGVIQQVSDAGGTAQPLTRFDKGEATHRWPEFLPGGKSMLFAGGPTTGNWVTAQVAVQSPTGERRKLIEGGTTPAIKLALAHRRTAELCKRMTSVTEIKQTAAKNEFLITWRVAGGYRAAQEIKFERSFAGLEVVMDTEDYDYGFLILPLGRLLKNLALKVSGVIQVG